ncbi:MAG: hypothetical protein M3O15_14600 [Acidobacteriota bacterium]|nr:hypothetical protein [Acidobacteriota bacterium]
MLALLLDLFALSRIEHDAAWFLESGYLDRDQAKAIRTLIDHLCGDLVPHLPALVDAWSIPDACHGAARRPCARSAGPGATDREAVRRAGRVLYDLTVEASRGMGDESSPTRVELWAARADLLHLQGYLASGGQGIRLVTSQPFLRIRPLVGVLEADRLYRIGAAQRDVYGMVQAGMPKRQRLLPEVP